MKNMIIRMLSCVLVLAVVSGLLTACDGNGNRENRESSVSGETINTVNPDISEPNQSIASGALITETTTAPTSKKDGATYVINGVEFTISKAIEDYLYTLPGSNSKYIDLDAFMQAYGFSRIDGKKAKESGHLYENKDGMRVGFDNAEFSFANNDGLGICKSVFLSYPSGAEGGQAACVYLSSDYPTDLEDGVYGANAVSKDDKIWVKYCVSRETLVVIAVLMDYSNSAGSNAGARDALSKAIDANGTGGGFEYVIK
jgi:hypothetical protein